MTIDPEHTAQSEAAMAASRCFVAISSPSANTLLVSSSGLFAVLANFLAYSAVDDIETPFALQNIPAMLDMFEEDVVCATKNDMSYELV